MISTKIDAKNDSGEIVAHDYRNLARYIINSGKDNEKVLYKWVSGCLTDEFDTSILEIECTQDKNTRSKSPKTYHLVVSFRLEDAAKLTEEIFKEIETEFAEVLGFGKHQRISGVHQNTKNIHLHVAYNKVNPEKYNNHSPNWDKLKRDKLCRELEAKYGLAVDIGIDKKKAEPKEYQNYAAKKIEAHTGQESFDSYVKRHKQNILEAIAKVDDWAGVHKVLFRYGLALKLHGNGLVIADSSGKFHTKASSLDRSFSKKNLEERFGLFETPSPADSSNVPIIETYECKPLGPEIKGKSKLYDEYLVKIEDRQLKLRMCRHL